MKHPGEHHEHLAQSDVGVIRLRKLLNQEFARQQAIYNAAMEKAVQDDTTEVSRLVTEEAEAEIAGV